MDLKQQAARKALEFVRSGMLLGLGSGSTSAHFIDLLGQSLASGALQDIRGVPTSEQTAVQARSLHIPLVSLSEAASSGSAPVLDLAVDGADEVDPQFNLIKGLGKALLREKVVEIHARRFIIIVDEGKLTPRLGNLGPLPVEITPFEAVVNVAWLNTLGCRAELWLDDADRPFVTDNGNYLARCWFERGIPDAYALAYVLAQRPGIVEHGLFLDMATDVIAAGPDGVRLLERAA